MKTRKLVLALTILLMATTLTYAKKRIDRDPNEIANRMVIRIQKDVALTDSQQLAIKELTVKYINQINDAEDNQRSTMGRKHKADLDSILTFSQKEQKKAKIQERINASQNKK